MESYLGFPFPIAIYAAASLAQGDMEACCGQMLHMLYITGRQKDASNINGYRALPPYLQRPCASP